MSTPYAQQQQPKRLLSAMPGAVPGGDLGNGTPSVRGGALMWEGEHANGTGGPGAPWPVRGVVTAPPAVTGPPATLSHYAGGAPGSWTHRVEDAEAMHWHYQQPQPQPQQQQQQQQQQPPKQALAMCTLFISSLPSRIAHGPQLRPYVPSPGVVDVRVKVSGGKTVGFVEYHSREAASQALEWFSVMASEISAQRAFAAREGLMTCPLEAAMPLEYAEFPTLYALRQLPLAAQNALPLAVQYSRSEPRSADAAPQPTATSQQPHSKFFVDVAPGRGALQTTPGRPTAYAPTNAADNPSHALQTQVLPSTSSHGSHFQSPYSPASASTSQHADAIRGLSAHSQLPVTVVMHTYQIPSSAGADQPQQWVPSGPTTVLAPATQISVSGPLPSPSPQSAGRGVHNPGSPSAATSTGGPPSVAQSGPFPHPQQQPPPPPRMSASALAASPPVLVDFAGGAKHGSAVAKAKTMPQPQAHEHLNSPMSHTAAGSRLMYSTENYSPPHNQAPHVHHQQQQQQHLHLHHHQHSKHVNQLHQQQSHRSQQQVMQAMSHEMSMESYGKCGGPPTTIPPPQQALLRPADMQNSINAQHAQPGNAVAPPVSTVSHQLPHHLPVSASPHTTRPALFQQPAQLRAPQHPNQGQQSSTVHMHYHSAQQGMNNLALGTAAPPPNSSSSSSVAVDAGHHMPGYSLGLSPYPTVQVGLKSGRAHEVAAQVGMKGYPAPSPSQVQVLQDPRLTSGHKVMTPHHVVGDSSVLRHFGPGSRLSVTPLSAHQHNARSLRSLAETVDTIFIMERRKWPVAKPADADPTTDGEQQRADLATPKDPIAPAAPVHSMPDDAADAFSSSATSTHPKALKFPSIICSADNPADANSTSLPMTFLQQPASGAMAQPTDPSAPKSDTHAANTETQLRHADQGSEGAGKSTDSVQLFNSSELGAPSENLSVEPESYLAGSGAGAQPGKADGDAAENSDAVTDAIVATSVDTATANVSQTERNDGEESSSHDFVCAPASSDIVDGLQSDTQVNHDAAVNEAPTGAAPVEKRADQVTEAVPLENPLVQAVLKESFFSKNLSGVRGFRKIEPSAAFVAFFTHRQALECLKWLHESEEIMRVFSAELAHKSMRTTAPPVDKK